MARKHRKKIYFVTVSRDGFRRPGRIKSDYIKDKHGKYIVVLPKDADVQYGDILTVPLFEPLNMMVTGVSTYKSTLRAEVFLFNSTASICRVGKYRDHLLQKDSPLQVGLLTVCVRDVVYTPLSPYIYDWDTHCYKGSAEFLMSACDARVGDHINLMSRMFFVPTSTDPSRGGYRKYYRYKVDAVLESEFPLLFKIMASAEDRKLPQRAYVLWSEELQSHESDQCS